MAHGKKEKKKRDIWPTKCRRLGVQCRYSRTKGEKGERGSQKEEDPGKKKGKRGGRGNMRTIYLPIPNLYTPSIAQEGRKRKKREGKREGMRGEKGRRRDGIYTFLSVSELRGGGREKKLKDHQGRGQKKKKHRLRLIHFQCSG